MQMLLDVIKVEPHKDYTLSLVFENSEMRIFDMKPYLKKKPFIKLKDNNTFLSAKIENGTAW